MCFPQVINSKSEEDEKTKALKAKVKMYHEVILAVCPKKSLPSIESLCKPFSAVNHVPHSEFILFLFNLKIVLQFLHLLGMGVNVLLFCFEGVPTAAALKSFPFPLAQGIAGTIPIVNSKAVPHQGVTEAVSAAAVPSTAPVLGPCGICRQSNDPHLLAHCDNCKQYYHLGCLNPPLTRMPKKTKLFGWYIFFFSSCQVSSLSFQ